MRTGCRIQRSRTTTPLLCIRHRTMIFMDEEHADAALGLQGIFVLCPYAFGQELKARGSRWIVTRTSEGLCARSIPKVVSLAVVSRPTVCVPAQDTVAPGVRRSAKDNAFCKKVLPPDPVSACRNKWPGWAEFVGCLTMDACRDELQKKGIATRREYEDMASREWRFSCCAFRCTQMQGGRDGAAFWHHASPRWPFFEAAVLAEYRISSVSDYRRLRRMQFSCFCQSTPINRTRIKGGWDGCAFWG